MSVEYNTTICRECEREVPEDVIEPVRDCNPTKYVCSECATDIRQRIIE